MERKASSSGPVFPTGLVRILAVSCLISAGAVFSGCASVNGGSIHDGRVPEGDAAAENTDDAQDQVTPLVVGYDEYRDPLISINRAIFVFNDVAYRYLLIPAGTGYVNIVPDPARRGIRNIFHNIRAPIYAVNNLLQAKPRSTGKNLARFGINTTVGLLGLFDPAKNWFDIPREDTDFDETLAGFGVGYGVYLVLPFFGPSDVRNSLSTFVDYALHPVPHFTDQPLSTAIRGLDYFQEYAPDAEHYRDLHSKFEDPYIFYRNLYLQGKLRDEEY